MSTLLASHDRNLRALSLGLLNMIQEHNMDLSARQLHILLTVCLTPGPHTVRGLAAGMGINKPAVIRALDRLSAGNSPLAIRKVDMTDRRSVLIYPTSKGRAFLGRLAEGMAEADSPRPQIRPPQTVGEAAQAA